ncbi:MAG: ATP-dependent DNA helicase RecG [Acidimicrobiales bacterium]
MNPTAAGRRLGQLAQLDVAVLRGVGNRKRAALGQMGISSVLDLVAHYPRRYADRTNAVAVGELVPGDVGVVSATVRLVSLRRLRGRRSIVEVVVDDGTGELGVTFFNQPWRTRQLSEGREVALFGKVDLYRGCLQMANPVVEVVGSAQTRQTRRIVPIYPQSGRAGISSAELASYIAESLQRAGEFADPLAPAVRAEFGLMSRTEAFRAIHEPETLAATVAARRRLAFDELFRIQVALVMRKRAAAVNARGVAHDVDGSRSGGRLVADFLEALPFELTAAQTRVIGEIRRDLASTEPMHRLLQGDVGAGKTIVAFATLLYAVQGGFQGAFMVPTEVLAEQHHLAARELLAGLELPDGRRLGGCRPVAIELLTSRTPPAARVRLFAGLRRGSVDLLIGTHALITEEVRFSSLGAVVIDEQHRFGVDQRAALREKGSAAGLLGHDPDLLVMTATPIPRTAAMTVYGDLDYSVLEELPPGRRPVTTRWVADDGAESEVWGRVRAEVAAGHQAFVVCPLIAAGSGAVDDDGLTLVETDEAYYADFDGGRLFGAVGLGAERRPPCAAVEEFSRLQAGELRGLRLGLLHGQLRPRDKEGVMAAFRRGALDVLVATTVVEVGVDVPAATVMVVEDADRFGIAQLHQLRGRVGRGTAAGSCYLMARDVSDEARRRLEALEGSHDGFVLAEIDLELRGEGTVLGSRQKGRSDLKLASLRRDRDLVDLARDVAGEVTRADPTLEGNPLLADELRIFVGEEEAEYLLRS